MDSVHRTQQQHDLFKQLFDCKVEGGSECVPPVNGTGVLKGWEWLVFIRIQKTGSTAFMNLLSHSIRAAEPQVSACSSALCGCSSCALDARPDLETYEPTAWNRPSRCHAVKHVFEPEGVCGRLAAPRALVDNAPHLGLSEASFLLGVRPPPVSRRVMWLTSLRSPVDRVRSEFDFAQKYGRRSVAAASARGTSGFTLFSGWDWATHEGWCGPFTLDNWLRCPNASIGARNRMTRMLLPLPVDPAAVDLNVADLEAATRSLGSFAWFGLLEYPVESTFLLQKLLGLPCAAALPACNANHARSSESRPPAVQSENTLIEIQNRLDVALYAAARRMFDARLIEAGARPTTNSSQRPSQW